MKDTDGITEIYCHADRKGVISCVGTDNKKHVCYPWEGNCCCGVPVLRKKLLKNDWQLYSCYPCTY